jgi:hypothetical protein
MNCSEQVKFKDSSSDIEKDNSKVNETFLDSTSNRKNKVQRAEGWIRDTA